MRYKPECDSTMGFGNITHRKVFLHYFFGEAKKVAEQSGNELLAYWMDWQLEHNLEHVDRFGASC
jgi:hypothetical protein